MTELITKNDLVQLKSELIQAFGELVGKQIADPPKRWLKTYDVRMLLGISQGTLQNLRINGTLSYSKIGGIIFYDYDEIQEILARNKISNAFQT